MKKKFPIHYKRQLAFAIDGIIIYFIGYLECSILLILTKDYYNSDLSFYINLSSIFLIFLLILYKDTVLPSGSVGKRIFGIGIYVGNTDKFASNKLKVKRVKEYIKGAFSYRNIRIDECKNDVDIKCNTRVDNIKRIS